MNRLSKQRLAATRRYRVRRAARVARESYLAGSTPGQFRQQPVIVVGMHRSGTSVTARIFDALGVEMGRDATERTHESLSYRARNEALLAVTRATWDNPRPFLDVVDDPGWRGALGTTLSATIETPWKWLLTDPHRAHDRDGRWGWKDPRTSITWPLWLDLYPDACFVRVRRERAAVVASLVERSRRRLGSRARPSFRTTTEHGAATLVDEYVASLDALAAAAPRAVVDVQYEELTDSPHTVVTRLAGELDLERARVESAVGLVRPRRR